MELLDASSMLKELKKLRGEPECQMCHENCQIPVKLRVCGHYFCEDCLKYKKKNVYSCPKCQIYFGERDVDYHNIAKETKNLLSELEECLINVMNIGKTSNNEKDTTEEDTSLKIQEKIHLNAEPGIIKYNNKRYRISFVEEHNNKVNNKGETPLHIACKRKKFLEVSDLLKKGVDINVQDFAGWAPLHEAVESGSEGIVESLLKHGALVDILGEEYTTPLHKASVSQKSELIKLLLNYGANKEVIDIFGKKPIEYVGNETIQRIFKDIIQPVDRIEVLCCNKKIVAHCYYIDKQYKEKLKKRKVKILEEYDSKKVTHFLIRKTHKVTLKILVAMLDGCTIVPQEWIDSFLNNDFFIPVPTYTFIDNVNLNEGIQKAMMNHMLKLPKLFNGINFFIYGHMSFIKIHGLRFTKESIAVLIKSGGGKLLHRAPAPRTCEEIVNFPYHARNSASKCCNYIIYEETNPPVLKYQMAEIRHKSSQWLVECVISFTILD